MLTLNTHTHYLMEKPHTHTQFHQLAQILRLGKRPGGGRDGTTHGGRGKLEGARKVGGSHRRVSG